MTIRPVSSVNFASGYNKVNFGGKRKNNSENSEKLRMTVPHRIAVPLAATVLAMSPLSSASASSLQMSELDSPNKIEMVDAPNALESNGAKVVASKTFPSYKSLNVLVTPKISLVNTKGGSGFDKIVYTESASESGKRLYDKDYAISNVTSAKFSLIGDDGVNAKTFTFNDAKVIDESSAMKTPRFPIFSQDMMNYVLNALGSDNNNSDIKVNNYNVGLRQSAISLQNVPNGDILKDAQPFKAFGDLEGSSSITTSNGSYKINFYSRDDNPDDAELITVKKEGYPELQVKAVYVSNAHFNENTADPQKYVYGSVFLLGRDKNGERQNYFLFDSDLAGKILAIFEQAPFQNALRGAYVINEDNYYAVRPSEKYIIPLDDLSK